MVRHTFLALAGGLLLATILAEPGKRRHVVAVALTLLLAVIAGLSARQSSTKVYTAYLTEEIYGAKVTEKTVRVRPQTQTQTKPGGPAVDAVAQAVPSCDLAVNVNRSNSIAIRRVLLMDALYLIPKAGLFGTGLDSFMNFSCIEAHEVHNSILQAAVEFGWIGGGLFLLLIIFAIYPLVPIARHNGAVRFVLCALVFTVLLSFAHGRFSRDSAVFALLGCSVGLCASARRAAIGGLDSLRSSTAGTDRSVTA
jgi:O-antigen ligase